jgi:hypothetical protein
MAASRLNAVLFIYFLHPFVFVFDPPDVQNGDGNSRVRRDFGAAVQGLKAQRFQSEKKGNGELSGRRLNRNRFCAANETVSEQFEKQLRRVSTTNGRSCKVF